MDVEKAAKLLEAHRRSKPVPRGRVRVDGLGAADVVALGPGAGPEPAELVAIAHALARGALERDAQFSSRMKEFVVPGDPRAGKDRQRIEQALRARAEVQLGSGSAPARVKVDLRDFSASAAGSDLSVTASETQTASLEVEIGLRGLRLRFRNNVLVELARFEPGLLDRLHDGLAAAGIAVEAVEAAPAVNGVPAARVTLAWDEG